MRRMETTDFEQANIEYIEFWVMDPFIEGQGAKTGGELVLNLGDISEDVLKDGRKSFEHGLPATAERTDLDSSIWGFVPRKQSLTPAFANTETSRQYQDIGLDGLSSEAERDYFNAYYQELQNLFTGNESDYIESLFEDVAQDDYHYYRGSDYDDAQLNILDRYKYYNNVDGNSPISQNTNETFAATG